MIRELAWMDLGTSNGLCTGIDWGICNTFIIGGFPSTQIEKTIVLRDLSRSKSIVYLCVISIPITHKVHVKLSLSPLMICNVTANFPSQLAQLLTSHRLDPHGQEYSLQVERSRSLFRRQLAKVENRPTTKLHAVQDLRGKPSLDVATAGLIPALRFMHN